MLIFIQTILDIDQLITISGMVIRTSNIIPEMREAFFRCNVCGNTASVEVDRGRILEPTLCSMCNTGYSYSIIHNRSQFSDRQMVKLQESPGTNLLFFFFSQKEWTNNLLIILVVLVR